MQNFQLENSVFIPFENKTEIKIKIENDLFSEVLLKAGELGISLDNFIEKCVRNAMSEVVTVKEMKNILKKAVKTEKKNFVVINDYNEIIAEVKLHQRMISLDK